MLTPPEPQQERLSRQLEAQIYQEIHDNNGWIGFERYMNLALYTPELGYYWGALEKFGAGGDFVTAPMMGNLFARCLARQCAEVLDRLEDGSIWEFGSGDGQLAADMLVELRDLGALPRRYCIVETSATLISRQRDTISARCAEFLDRVDWVDRLPDEPLDGVIIANEVLDAIPALCFRIDENSQAREMGVSLSGDNLSWQSGVEPLPEWVRQRIESMKLPPGYCSEVGRQAEAWVRTVAERLGSGIMLLIDYGFPRHEYYHRDRQEGTLMCHYRHQAHSDPFFKPGLQDITSHVDFTSIWHAARRSGLDLLGFTTQAGFLLSLGVLDMLSTLQRESGDDPGAALVMSQHVKKLLQPHEMGELFKVIALGRNFPVAPGGFAMADHRDRLE